MSAEPIRRVLLVGETEPGGLTGSYARAMRAAGLQVEVFDYYAALLAPRPIPSALQRIAWAPLSRPPQELRAVGAARRAQPDVVLFIKCDDWHDWAYGLLRRACPRARLAAFHPDDPFRARRLLRRAPSHRRATIQMREVDHYFIWSDALLAPVRAAGARSASYLAFAADPTMHRPAELSAHERRALGAEVVFIGNWDERRERWLCAFEGSGLDLAIWGTDYWSTRCRSRYLRSCWRGRPVIGEEFAKAVAASGLCVNVLREQNVGAHNMRTFEVPACRGILLAEWSADQARHFAAGEEALYGRSPDELVREAVGALSNPARLEAMRDAALARALGATYRHRWEQIGDALDGAGPRAGSTR